MTAGKRRWPRATLAAMLVLMSMTTASMLSGCSDDGGDASGTSDEDHVLKGQKEAIDKARDVGRQLGEAAKRKDAAQQ